MNFDIEFEQEEDGRWIAEIPGVLAYGVTPLQAGAKALALRVIAERMENEDSIPSINSIPASPQSTRQYLQRYIPALWYAKRRKIERYNQTLHIG